MLQPFNPMRLVEARACSKLTGEELAERVGVKKQAISQFENGKSNPEYDTIKNISEALGFPVEFFYENPKDVLVGNTFFRAQFTSNKRDLNSQKIKASYVAHLHYTLSRFVDFPHLNLPNFDDNVSPTDAAKKLRDYWGLGNEPIADIINVMERNGIIMSEFATDSAKIDAFSQYVEINEVNTWCVILGNEKRSFVRRQFSCAHELGHILLHEKYAEFDSVEREEFRKREDEANEFAAELLLPSDSFYLDLKIQPNRLNRYIDLKRKWKVSISAMVMRAYALEAINANQYQYLMRQISANGWRTSEPLDDYLPLRHPKALKQAVNLILLNNVIDGYQLIAEVKKDGVSLPKKIIDDVLNLESETISISDKYILNDTSSSKVIPFALLKERRGNDGK